MDKIKLNLLPVKNKSFYFSGKFNKEVNYSVASLGNDDEIVYKIEVIPYLKVDEIDDISDAYILSTFSGKPDSWNATLADFMMRKIVVDKSTNIDTTDLDASGLDCILNSDLYTSIINRIENYDDMLDIVKNNLKNEIARKGWETSMAMVLKELVAKLEPYIEEISKLPLPEVEKEPKKITRKKHKGVSHVDEE